MKNNRDTERIRKQEDIDYNTTKSILSNIFNRWNTSFTQTPEFSPSDMRFQVQKDNSSFKYNVEIKTRNQDMNRYKTLPLKMSKYCRLLADTKHDEKLIYVVLVNGEEYYIFDLDKVDLNQCEFKNWKIQKQEYNVNGSAYEEVPAMFIPINQIIFKGKY